MNKDTLAIHAMGLWVDIISKPDAPVLCNVWSPPDRSGGQERVAYGTGADFDEAQVAAFKMLKKQGR